MVSRQAQCSKPTVVRLLLPAFIASCCAILPLGGCGDDSGTNPSGNNGHTGFDPNSEWVFRYSGTDLQLHALAFLSDTVCIAGGYGGDDDSCVVVSHDAGDTWTRVPYPRDRQYQFHKVNAIEFFDQQRGLATLNYGKYLLTQDGGATWVANQIGDEEFFDLNCPSPSVAVMIGHEIQRSTDGGLSWNAVPLPPQIQDLYYLGNLSFVNELVGYAAGTGTVSGIEGGILLKTQNAGASWELVSSAIPGEIYDCCFTTDAIGYVVGPDSLLLKTTNSGGQWQALQPAGLGQYASFSAVCFVDSEIGFVSGDDALGNFVYRTVDGGSTWTPVTYDPRVWVLGIEVHGSRGLMFGDNGAVFKSSSTE